MLTQIAIPCYFGNEIIVTHDHLTRSIFNSGWYSRSAEHRRVVVMLMEIVKRKLSILVGNLFELNLDLLVSVSLRLHRVVLKRASIVFIPVQK